MRRFSDIITGLLYVLAFVMVIALMQFLAGCGAGYYVADTDHDVNVKTHKTTDVEQVCGRLLPERRQPTDREYDRYLECVKSYGEDTDVVDSNTVDAVVKVTKQIPKE